VLDGATTNSKIGGEMRCIDIHGQFGDRASSMKIEKKRTGAAKGMWKNVGSATGNYTF